MSFQKIENYSSSSYSSNAARCRENYANRKIAVVWWRRATRFDNVTQANGNCNNSHVPTSWGRSNSRRSTIGHQRLDGAWKTGEPDFILKFKCYWLYFCAAWNIDNINRSLIRLLDVSNQFVGHTWSPRLQWGHVPVSSSYVLASCVCLCLCIVNLSRSASLQ